MSEKAMRLRIAVDRLSRHYPFGIAKSALGKQAALESRPVYCQVIVDAEDANSETSRAFISSVCEKGLGLKSEEYHINREEDLSGDVESWIEETSTPIVIAFRDTHDQVEEQKVRGTNYIQTPCASMLALSDVQKRSLWGFLKPLRKG
jgi:hypothetical protein